MTRQKIRRRAHEFINVRGMDHLATVLDVPLHALTLQSAYVAYEEFSIPKPSGGLRFIENPYPGLKDIQKKLNRFFQAVYFIHKTKAAYGFIIDVKKEADRNIVTNAAQHLNRSHLLNMDFKDFFHCVKKHHINKMMCAKPFEFNIEISKTISELCCYKGRLPMGAPTSPVLTNFYCIPLDRVISKFCDGRNIRYSRYADDMSFSKSGQIELEFSQKIIELSDQYDLTINPKKTKWYAPTDIKKVTGIIVSSQLDVPHALIHDTLMEIRKLKNIMEIKNRYRKPHEGWVKHHQQKIRGYIQFVKQVKGISDPLVKELKSEYNKAMNPPNTSDPISWQELPYQFL